MCMVIIICDIVFVDCRFGIDHDVPVSYRVSCSSQATLQECAIYGYRPSLRIPGGVVCRPNVLDMQSKYSGILKQPR